MPESLEKARTGIVGFDLLSGGGVPRGRATLVLGDAGAGKTVFALQSLVNGARDHSEPGLFVAFEEDVHRIVTNAEKFGWDLPTLQHKKLFFIDAQPAYDMIQSGHFDLGGMLAALGAKVDELGAKRIVFDAIDVVLALMDDPAQVRRELYRLHEWLLKKKLTAFITAKATDRERHRGDSQIVNFMQFMVDCLVVLGHDVVERTSQRYLRIVKFRGSAFSENATPFLIGATGIEVATARDADDSALPATHDRVSSGMEPLDVMLGGGFFRGGSVLLTGGPGTAKTTLCGIFAEAACRRGEKALFITFDSRIDELIRDLSSVEIHLRDLVDSGSLLMISVPAVSGSAETHLANIKNLATEHGAQYIVIDSLSALSHFDNRASSLDVAERLIAWAKGKRITLMCTSLPDRLNLNIHAVPLQISTITDTWIQLSYVEHAGERNRAISVIKSRGTKHSNQVRELVLSNTGVTLTDVYTVGGEVLMGALRWTQERAERIRNAERVSAANLRRLSLEAKSAELEARLKTLEREIALVVEERKTLVEDEFDRVDDLIVAESELRSLRVENNPQAPADD